LTDRNTLDAPELGVEIAAALVSLFPGEYKSSGLDGLLVNKSTLEAIAAGQDPRRIAEQWRDGLEQFESVRAKYLLY
jgi:hypothetical protein